jgi:hypothetical protein
MRNRYTETCYRCGKPVLPGEGHPERFRGTWRVQHVECCQKARDAVWDHQEGGVE